MCSLRTFASFANDMLEFRQFGLNSDTGYSPQALGTVTVLHVVYCTFKSS